jgi:RNA polymerase sigma-70 factor (ECF subfamily)
MARALARPLVRPPQSAEDVVQEAALALHRAVQAEPGRFASHEHARNYFLRSVRNLAARSVRGAGREAGFVEEPAARDESALRAVLRRQETLARVLEQLPPEARELVRRRFLAGETLADVARATGVPVSTLHDRERAALAELRRNWDRLTEEEA